MSKRIAAGVAVVSASLVAFVRTWEGREHVPYRDIVGVVTYCDGITSPPPIPGKAYTDAECDALSQTNLTKHGEGVLSCVKVMMTQRQYEAFTSLAYNIGTGAFCRSTLVRLLNAGDHAGACRQILRWDYAGGKRVRGLTNRRKAEYALCVK